MDAIAKCSSEPGSLSLVERPKPEPAADEALVAVRYAGLCGSDAGIYEFDEAYHGMEFPRVIGHEYAGEVVALGDDVTAVEIGDHVVERPIRSCGECLQCRTGTPNICRDSTITGVDHDGAYAPYIATPADSLHVLPRDLPLHTAAIAEPASVATRAVLHNSGLTAGDRVRVAGPGPIGLLVAQVADSQGGTVFVSGVERDADYRLPLARDLGFETVNVATGSLADRVAECTDGTGLDVVFDTTGHPSGLQSATEAVGKGGQVVIVGLAGPTELDVTALVRSELDLQCSYASTWEDFERAIRLIEAGSVDAASVIDARFSLRDHQTAFEAFLAGETCKPVFDVTELR